MSNREILGKEKNDGIVRARIVKVRNNFGFALPENGKEDIFVPSRRLKGALPGDIVKLKIHSRGGRKEGRVVSFEEPKETFSAYIVDAGGSCWAALSACPDITVRVKNRGDAAGGDIAMVTINGRGTRHEDLTATVVRTLGKIRDRAGAVRVVLAENGADRKFTARVEKQAKAAYTDIDFDKRTAGRKDFTDLCIFTIDGADTKDIDDAVYVRKTPDGFILGVFIADVSYYIPRGSPVDAERKARGSSIYYGNSVIPMLPVRYSNDLCSLNPGEKRLSFACIMDMDNSGKIQKYEFTKAVISSRVKGVYSEINKIFEGQRSEEIEEKYSCVSSVIPDIKQLYEVLKNRRKAIGSMDIESDEAKIIFDEEGGAVDIKRRESGPAEEMIEEFMLCANLCAADFAVTNGLPFVYRVHDAPDKDKLDSLNIILAKAGLSVSANGDKTLQKSMSEALDAARGTNYETVIHRRVLRSQSKAVYDTRQKSHFALSARHYSHFTSPIRRYADLTIHRIMSDYLSGKREGFELLAQEGASRANEGEARSLTVERDATDIYAAEVMSRHIGDEYEGIIVSVTNYGVYVCLENTCEGLVHVSRLDLIDPEITPDGQLFCQLTGQRYEVGQNIKVKVASVNILKGNIDFEPVADNKEKTGKNSGKKIPAGKTKSTGRNTKGSAGNSAKRRH